MYMYSLLQNPLHIHMHVSLHLLNSNDKINTLYLDLHNSITSKHTHFYMLWSFYNLASLYRK